MLVVLSAGGVTVLLLMFVAEYTTTGCDVCMCFCVWIYFGVDDWAWMVVSWLFQPAGCT